MSLVFLFNFAYYIFTQNIMWHIIITLTLVYGSLYKIIKEYTWNINIFIFPVFLILNNFNDNESHNYLYLYSKKKYEDIYDTDTTDTDDDIERLSNKKDKNEEEEEAFEQKLLKDRLKQELDDYLKQKLLNDFISINTKIEINASSKQFKSL